MITSPQFYTRWRPELQAGKRHRSFIVHRLQSDALWTGFSRPLMSADISGAFSVAKVEDQGSARPHIAVSVVTWDALNLATEDVPVTYHYMLRTGASVGLGYIPLYTGERLLSTAQIYFWSAPPPFGTTALTGFQIKILTFGQANPFDNSGYVQQQELYTIALNELLYTEPYPVDSDPTIEANQFPIS